MSFAADTKRELTTLEVNDCCARAELAALTRMNGFVSIRNKRVELDIATENAAISRRIYRLIKQVYHYRIEILVRRKMRLKKNNVCLLYTSDAADE